MRAQWKNPIEQQWFGKIYGNDESKANQLRRRGQLESMARLPPDFSRVRALLRVPDGCKTQQGCEQG
jgi:hypothetical protein